jgi:hypothetical protein
MASKIITKYGDISPRLTGKAIGDRVHTHTPSPPDPVADDVSQGVTEIAKSIDAEITRQVDNRVKDVLEEGGKDEWLAWFQGEIEQWKQRCEELEIELECMRNAFPEDDHDVLPKHRGIFGA